MSNQAQDLVDFLADKNWKTIDALATLAYVQLRILEASGLTRKEIEENFLFGIDLYYKDIKNEKSDTK